MYRSASSANIRSLLWCGDFCFLSVGDWLGGGGGGHSDNKGIPAAKLPLKIWGRSAPFKAKKGGG